MTTDAELCRRLVGLIDLTSLNDARDDDIAALCAKVITPEGPVAAVCSWPEHAAEMARRLQGTPVKIAVVLNFPGGNEPKDKVLEVARKAMEGGAQELDLVWPYRAWLEGDQAQAADLVRDVKAVAGDRCLKVILESGALGESEAISAASAELITAGADMLKTSTGKIPQGANLPAASTMLNAIRTSGRPVGFKASGGIRTPVEAAAYLSLAEEIMGPDWATVDRFRVGASRLLDALLEAKA